MSTARIPDGTPMRFAYADPPYPGQAKRWYGNHPDYAGEVDHAELIARLEGYDGWALSTNAVGLQSVLAVCPRGVRVAAWHNPSSQPPGAIGGWWWTWEPLIVHGGRPGPVVRNLLTAGVIGRENRFPGGKPRAFSRWVFALLGAQPGDELDDLFTGSGAVTAAWLEYQTQPWLEPTAPDSWRKDGPRRTARRLAATMEELV